MDALGVARFCFAFLLVFLVVWGAQPDPPAETEPGPAAVAPASPAPGWEPEEGAELIGRPAPEWEGIEWLQGGPLTLSGLRRKAVLLRFWLIDCPYCVNTAPALRELWDRYRERGLVVVGLHHPKSEAARDPAVVARGARSLGFDFPIGIDNEWATLRAYGVGTKLRRFTSVSFLIDREGILRFVHDGGEFHAGGGQEHETCNAAYAALIEKIEEVLGE